MSCGDLVQLQHSRMEPAGPNRRWRRIWCSPHKCNSDRNVHTCTATAPYPKLWPVPGDRLFVNIECMLHAQIRGSVVVDIYCKILRVMDEWQKQVIHLINSLSSLRVYFLIMCWRGIRTDLKSDTFVESGGSPLLFCSLCQALILR